MVRGRPRHSQSQGSVEGLNRTCHDREGPADWDEAPKNKRKQPTDRTAAKAAQSGASSTEPVGARAAANKEAEAKEEKSDQFASALVHTLQSVVSVLYTCIQYVCTCVYV